MQNNMQIWLESSTTTFNLNSHDEGVYLVSDLDGLTSLPDIRTSQGVNAGTDGGWTSAQAFDARLISLNIVIANEDESIVESKRRTLNSLLAQSRKESLKLHFISEAGMEYVISVRVTNVSGALSNILKKQNLLIQMRADDPIIYGTQGGEGADATLTVQQAQGGFEIPFDIPLIIGGGTDKVNVENLGSEEVYPVIKMTGPLHNPTVVNETQNAEIGVNADLGDMEWRGYESAEIYGNTTQQAYTGKNLLPYPSQSGSTTIAGVQFTQSADGKVVASGTTTGGMNWWFTDAFYPSTTGTYAMSFTGQHNNVSFFCYDITTSQVAIRIDSSQSSSQAIGTLTAGHRYQIYFNQGSTGVNVSINGYAQLELGSTATTYEPYCGGVPSPNPDYPQEIKTVTGAQTVKITGKNIFDDATLYHGYYLPSSPYGKVADEKYRTAEIELKAGTYTFSCDLENCYMLRLFADGESITINTAKNSHTFTTSTDGTVMICFRNTSTSTITQDVKCQLELGNQATTYEPYQAQSYEINLGKNLLDIDNIAVTNAYIANDGTETPSNTNLLCDYQPVSPNTYYTLSVNTSIYNLAFAEYDANKTYILRTVVSPTSTNTIITNASTRYIRVSFNRNNGSTITRDYVKSIEPQLEKNDQATSYAPYKTPIELAKIGTYQDYIYKSGDKWYKHAEVGKVAFDGSEAWSSANSNAYFYRTLSDAIILPSSSTMPPVMSDYYTPANRDDLWASRANYGVGLYDGSLARVMIRNKDCANSTAFKTWLSTHNTTVYYALATPTDTEITDSELVEQLEALLDYAPWYGEDQNVFLIPSAGAQGELILGAHNEPKPADVVLIDTQLKTVTINGQNAYPLLKDGSSFFTLAPGDNTMYLTSDVSSDTGKAEIKFKQGFISI